MKKTIVKNMTLGFACLLGVGAVVAGASAFNVDKPFEEVHADGSIEFIYRYWNEGKKEVVSVPSTCLTYTTVTSTTTSWTNDKWYVVNEDVTIGERITVSGEANLILCNDVTLTTNMGIRVEYGNTLNIFGQEGDKGKLVSGVTAEYNETRNAGIGSNQNSTVGSGVVNIHGGDLTITSSKASAGIGTGRNFTNTSNIKVGAVTIFGGTVVTTSSYNSAGIGSGLNYTSSTIDIEPITIYGGDVTATGGLSSAGIGGGQNYKDGTVNVGPITINGGKVTATAGISASAIGGGDNYGVMDGVVNVGQITINGGDVTATSSFDAASIGGGRNYQGNPSYTVEGITINGGTIIATGENGNTGIGGGTNGNTTDAAGDYVLGPITINGGTITARGNNRGPGIGGGTNGGSYSASGDYSIGPITINGGDVTANNEQGSAPGIGAGINTSTGNLSVGKITINGGLVNASSTNYAAGIGLSQFTGASSEERTSFEGVEINGGEVNARAGDSHYDAIGATSYNPGPSERGPLIVSSSLTVLGNASGTPTYPDDIKTAEEYATTRWQYMQVKSYHVHSWSYSAINNSIHATCNAADCPIDPNDPSLNLSIKEENFVFDNTAKTISFVDGYNTQAFDSSDIDIAYLQNNTPVTECINAGTYEARVTVEDATISGTFNITQATPTGYDIPTDLEANYGDNLSSVVLPSTWSWKTPTDKVGDAGSREHIAIYTPTDPNYKAVEEILTINVKTVDPDPVGTLDATFGQKLSDIALPNGWAWTDATQSVGNVGSHDFAAHYTAVDINHHDKDAYITVSVSQATPTDYDIPTDLKATYGDTLSSVELPDTWAWKNPNDKVGNAGSREHIAIYTPTDPNYKAVENILTVAVSKANPSVPTLDTIEAPYDVALSTIGLPEGFSWMDGTQKTSTWGENTFKAKYTPSDTVNYNVVENIDIKVNVKWILVDPTEGDVTVTINDGETEYNVDISVKVEVKTEVTVDEKRTEYASIGREFIKQDEDINAIYSVKLIRTIDGVEQEIQPSDIKEGTKIIVSMPVPEQLVGKPFRLLEIFSTTEAKEMENYALSKDGKTLVVEVDRMGEFAFVSHTDVPNGFDYSTGLPGWAIALIIIGSILLLCLLCFFLLFFVFNKWIRKDDKAIRAVKFGKKDNKVRLLVMPFRFEYREESQIFNSKSEALK